MKRDPYSQRQQFTTNTNPTTHFQVIASKRLQHCPASLRWHTQLGVFVSDFIAVIDFLGYVNKQRDIDVNSR